jgi:hypothetical protein
MAGGELRFAVSHPSHSETVRRMGHPAVICAPRATGDATMTVFLNSKAKAVWFYPEGSQELSEI